MKHRYQKVKIAVVLICVLAAGICYSCGRGRDGWESGELQVPNGQEDVSLAGADLEESKTADASVSGSAMEGLGESKAPDGEDMDQSMEESTAAACYVHICGEVASPGVYEMEEGSRVFQAVELAGGFTEQAASQYLNMAQPVCDGMKIVVPSGDSLNKAEYYGLDSGNAALADAAAGIIMPGTNSSGNGSGGVGNGITEAKVNLNTASKEELMALKGIGEAKADDIISYRESHGGFQKIEDIMKISGIKNAAFEKIKDSITV